MAGSTQCKGKRMWNFWEVLKDATNKTETVKKEEKVEIRMRK